MPRYISKIKANENIIFNVINALIVFFATGLCIYLAYETDFNTAPDEELRFLICKFVFNNLSLPLPEDPSIVLPGYGFSYAYTPYTAQIISGILMRTMTLFSSSEHMAIFAARITSAAFITLYSIFIIKISKMLFCESLTSILFTVFCVFLPQVIYLGSYINNDSMSLFASSMIFYSWLKGHKKCWDFKSCVTLGVSVSVCLLSYYYAYAYVAVSILFFLWSSWTLKLEFSAFLKKSAFILFIVFLLSGWFFIRNFIILDGDIFGLSSQRIACEHNGFLEFKPSHRETMYKSNIGIFEMIFGAPDWSGTTLRSFVGYFGWMSIPLPWKYYLFYIMIITLGLVGFIYSLIEARANKLNNRNASIYFDGLTLIFKKRDKFVFIFCLLIMLINVSLSLYYSYFNDFQPQGRYVITCIIPIFLIVVFGLKILFSSIIKSKNVITVIYLIIILIVLIIVIVSCKIIVTS